MATRVAAIVVTYNRKQLLPECLKGLLGQTQPVDEIIIVDNHSTDGTRETLVDAGYLSATRDSGHTVKSLSGSGRAIRVSFVEMPANEGPSAAYARGMKVAFDAGFDWVWTMDDDVVPMPGALEALMAHGGEARCIIGERQNPDGSLFQWPAKFDLTTFKAYHYSREEAEADKRHPDGICWEGMLLHRSVIGKVGYPNEAIFIGYDDTEYGLRVSETERILHIKDRTVRRLLELRAHQRSLFGLGIARRPRETAWKTYYSVRNLFFLRRRFPRGMRQLMFLWIHVVRKIVSPLVFLDDAPFLRVRLGLQGAWDGLTKVNR